MNKVEVTRDLSLRIPPGRITCIVGENACGKSTLLRGLARLMMVSPPDPFIARTSEGGRSWTSLDAPCTGFKSRAHEAASGLAASEPGDLWLVCGDEPASGAMQSKHLFRASDGGRS
jgi:iron complex transport system ATP-binding protein